MMMKMMMMVLMMMPMKSKFLEVETEAARVKIMVAATKGLLGNVQNSLDEIEGGKRNNLIFHGVVVEHPETQIRCGCVAFIRFIFQLFQSEAEVDRYFENQCELHQRVGDIQLPTS